MKKLLLLTFLLLNLISYSQQKNIAGTAVQGIIPVKRTASDVSSPKGASNKTASSANTTPSNPTGNSAEVGVTAGQLSVSLSGAANYNIPINLPPGINGVMPAIGLSYSSQAGNGLVGYGWNLSGLSKISRIAATKYHDGINDPVDGDALDRFAIDGQRLIKKNTGDVYGANGTVYETENFSNIKVTSYGTTYFASSGQVGPGYFIVEYPDGSKAKFGGNDDYTSVMDWVMEYWDNPQGLRIKYNYSRIGAGQSNVQLKSIWYGSLNPSGSGTTGTTIDFFYKYRQRYETALVGRNLLSDNCLLTEIRIRNNSVAFKNYVLGYDAIPLGYERLISITEKSGDNTKSYNPTVFTYDTTEEAITYKEIPTTLSVNNINYANSETLTGDFDGDGKRDIILYPTTGTNDKKKYWLFNDIEGESLNIGYEHNVGAFEEIFPISWLGGSAGNYKLMPMQGWCVQKKNTTTNVTSFTNYALSLGSFYIQDTKDHVFPKFDTTTGELDYTGVNATNFKEIKKKYLSGDFNGDGISDVLAIEENVHFTLALPFGDKISQQAKTGEPGGGGGGEVVNYTGNTYFVNLDRRLTTNYVLPAGGINITDTSRLIVDDVNGDGKSDVLVFSSGAVKVYSMDENSQMQLLSTTTDSNIQLGSQILMGDYNGDGRSDFLIPKGPNSYIYSRFNAIDTGFYRQDQTYQIPNAQGAIVNGCPAVYYIIPSDFNKDGKTDLILAMNYACASTGAGYISVNNYMNTGTSFVEESNMTTGIQFGIGAYATPVFLNNDKQNSSNVINFITNNKIIHFNSKKDLGKDRLLKSITLGNGVTERITYAGLDNVNTEAITNTHYYPSTYTENYPNFDIKVAPSINVVTTLENISQSGYKKQNYKYFGAVANMEGLGFLGFRSVAKTNWFNDDFTPITSISKFDMTKRGAIVENYTVLGEIYGDFSDFSATDYISKSTMSYTDQLMPNKVYKITNTHNVEYNGLEGTSKEVVKTFNADNYPLTQTTETKSGTIVEQQEVMTWEYTPNDISGLPIKKTGSVVHNGDTKTSEELYTYTNYQLTQIEKKGHQTNSLKENNAYNSFGNLITKTITAVGLPPRVTNYQYHASQKYVESFDTDGLSTQYAYNHDKGLLISETDPLGRMTKFDYDTWGKKIKVTDPLNNDLTIGYTNLTLGHYSISSTDADDSYSLAEYDDLGRVVKSTVKGLDGVNSYVSTQYDIYDRVVSVSEPYLQSPTLYSTSEYDIYGRLIKTVAPTGKTTNIAYNGQDQTVADEIKTVITSKDAQGRPVYVNDTGGSMNYEYYADGNLKKSEGDGGAIEFEYNGWGQKSKMTDPSAGTYDYEYNDFGELTKEIVQLKGTTEYTLDNYGRIIKKTIKGTGTDMTDSETVYNYHPTTKVLESMTYDDIQDANHHIDYLFQYDPITKLLNYTKETSTNKSVFEHTIKTFDIYGRPLVEVYKATNTPDGKFSERTIKNTYKNGYHYEILEDGTNKLLWRADSVNARGQVTAATYGNGITATNTYDVYGFPTQFKHEKGAVDVMTLNTVFNPLTGNLTSRTNSMFTSGQAFEYDTLDRLTSWTGALRELYNLTFSTSTEGFTGNSGGAVSLLTNRLKVTGSNPRSGAIKTIVDKTIAGSKYKIKATIDDGVTGTGVYQLSALVIETNRISPSISTVLGTLTDGVFEAEYTVKNDDYQLILKFEKSENNASAVLLRDFYIDDVIVSEVNEVQQYDNLGRVMANKLGKYGYNDPDWKVYRHTSIEITPESNSYYANREGIFNDGMEEESGWALELGNWGTDVSAMLYDSTKAKQGKKSLKINNTTGSEKTILNTKWIAIDNAVATPYTYSVWAFSDGPQAQAFLYMDNGSGITTDNIVSNATGAWSLITKTVMIPANVKKIALRLDNNGTTNGNIWFDDARINKASNPVTGLRRLDIAYNVFKNPISIEESDVEKINFLYNPFNGRSSSFSGSLDTDKMLRPLRKHYSADGTMEIKHNIETGKVEFITYLGGDAYSAPVVSKSDGTNQEYLYLHRDYQSTILGITNEAGNIVEKRLFDAWGTLLKAQDGAGNNLIGLTVLDRGYTGHEHLQSVGLIHMNGRLYDPKLHRFLQPDNFIQDPYNSQNYNRYGYVMNNPTKYTDFSGEEACNCVVTNGGGQVENDGLSNTNQTILGNLIGSLVTNWDNLRIKEWSNKNLNFNSWGNGIKSAGKFLARNAESIGGWFHNNYNSIFGKGKQEAQQLPPSPSFSNHQLSSGWQNQGVGTTGSGQYYGGDGSGSFGDYFSRFVYETDQFNPIALAWDGIQGHITGNDRYGNELTGFESSVKIVSAVPMTKVAGVFSGAAGKITLNGGKTFAQYKIARGGTETLAHIQTSTGVQRISTEFHHMFITQRMQRAYGLPNWLVNNRMNVFKLNTIQHSIIDPFRFRFLRAGMKPQVGWFNEYNWFTKF